MTSRPARVLRGLAAALFAVFVAALSHVAGGGSAPGLVGLVLAVALSSVVCVALAGRSLSIIRLGISVVVSQLVFHGLFSVGASSGADVITMSGMGHHGSLVVTVTPGLVPAGSGSTPAAGLGGSLVDAASAQLCSGMWIAHAVAAVVTILALRRGEAAFWSLVALASRRFSRLARPLFVEPSPLRRPDRTGSTPEPDHLRDLGIFLGGLRHRGPPVCVRFAT